MIPGELSTPTGGYQYDRRMIEGLRGLGWDVRVSGLDPRFPRPDRRALVDAAARLARIGAGERVLIDGLALGAMPEQARAEAHRLRLIALVHHPLALESGLTPARAERLRVSETAALAAVRRVIVTSRATARTLQQRYGVAPRRICVVAPGTDPAPLAHGSAGGPLHLLCVGAVTPRKGHLLLIHALATLRAHDWRLDCIGSLERDPRTAAALQRSVQALDLEGRVFLHGVVAPRTLAAAYDSADLFVLPSRFEGYGMAFAEALARGLPVLGTRAGAIPDTVPADAGVLVAPNSVAALRDALERLLADAGLRARLAAGARRARTRLPLWAASCRELAAVLRAC